jgi:hypothetical protein
MVDQLRSERLAYEFMVAEFEKRHDNAMLKRLAAAPVSQAHGIPKRYLAVRDKAMHRLGVGTTHDMRSVITGVFLPSLASRSDLLPARRVRPHMLLRPGSRLPPAAAGPIKGFYTFEHSAHSPIFEEPEKAGRIMRDDVLNAVVGLADG